MSLTIHILLSNYRKNHRNYPLHKAGHVGSLPTSDSKTPRGSRFLNSHPRETQFNPDGRKTPPEASKYPKPDRFSICPFLYCHAAVNSNKSNPAQCFSRIVSNKSCKSARAQQAKLLKNKTLRHCHQHKPRFFSFWVESSREFFFLQGLVRG